MLVTALDMNRRIGCATQKINPFDYYDWLSITSCWVFILLFVSMIFIALAKQRRDYTHLYGEFN